MFIFACIVTLFCETFHQAQVDFKNFVLTIYQHNRVEHIVKNNQSFDWEAWQE
jgi:hypothetical protein